MAEEQFTTGGVPLDINQVIGRFSTIQELAETICDKSLNREVSELAHAICDVARVGSMVAEDLEPHFNLNGSSETDPESGDVDQREAA